jgi:hypothetical protein
MSMDMDKPASSCGIDICGYSKILMRVLLLQSERLIQRTGHSQRYYCLPLGLVIVSLPI